MERDPLVHKTIQSANKQRRWASQQQAADYLGVTTRTIRQMIADGKICGYRSSSRLIRVDLNELDAAMTPFGGAV